MKSAIIDLLKSNGMEVAADASDETVEYALAEFISRATHATDTAPANVLALQSQAQTITAQLTETRKEVATRDVQACIDEGRIPAAMKDKAIARVLADASYLDELRSLPPLSPGYPQAD